MFDLEMPDRRMRRLAKDRALPQWLRVSLLTAAIVFQIALFGTQMSNIEQLAKPSNELRIWGVGVLYSTVAIVATVLGLQELRRAGLATGKRTLVGQMTHILLRTFLFVLLPCMLITLLLVLWATATHQPAFS
jgi:uncharacterized membrane protein YidH (DUF202 family)